MRQAAVLSPFDKNRCGFCGFLFQPAEEQRLCGISNPFLTDASLWFVSLPFKCAFKCVEGLSVWMSIEASGNQSSPRCPPPSVSSFILQSPGCDDYLGSGKVMDRCGICGGDNTTCKLVSGVFKDNVSRIGYRKIVEIPEGATKINVTEMAKSRNYLGGKTDAEMLHTLIEPAASASSNSAAAVGLCWQPFEAHRASPSLTATGPLTGQAATKGGGPRLPTDDPTKSAALPGSLYSLKDRPTRSWRFT